jgi:hypothetical protein
MPRTPDIMRATASSRFSGLRTAASINHWRAGSTMKLAVATYEPRPTLGST